MSHFYLNNKEKAITQLQGAIDIVGMDGLKDLITDESVQFYLERSMVELKLMEPDEKPPADKVNPTRNPASDRGSNTDARATERNLEQQIKANPKDPSLYYTLYEHHLANDNPAEARKTMANLVKNNPNEAKGYYLLGRMLYKKRDLKAAETNLRKVFELRNIVTIEEYVQLEARVYQILAARLKGDKERAFKMLADWSNVLTEERVRYLDLDGQDRAIFQGIVRSEEYQQSLNAETQPNEEPTEEANENLDIGNLVTLDQVDTVPVLRERIDPKYTSVALKRGITGQVILNLLISETGDVIDVKVIQGLSAGLTEETVKAVNQWKYEPAMKDGQAVKVWKRITITFK
jgi:TonB family protein